MLALTRGGTPVHLHRAGQSDPERTHYPAPPSDRSGPIASFRTLTSTTPPPRARSGSRTPPEPVRLSPSAPLRLRASRLAEALLLSRCPRRGLPLNLQGQLCLRNRGASRGHPHAPPQPSWGALLFLWFPQGRGQHGWACCRGPRAPAGRPQQGGRSQRGRVETPRGLGSKRCHSPLPQNHLPNAVPQGGKVTFPRGAERAS